MTDTPLHVWRASKRAFARRCIGLYVVTNLLLLPGWHIVGGVAMLVTAACLSLVYMFVLDDFADWLHHHNATWTLTQQALLYENPDEDMERHSLSLLDITTVQTRFWWSVVLRLSDGQAVTMSYIDDPKRAKDMIEHTKDAMG